MSPADLQELRDWRDALHRAYMNLRGGGDKARNFERRSRLLDDVLRELTGVRDDSRPGAAVVFPARHLPSLEPAPVGQPVASVPPVDAGGAGSSLDCPKCGKSRIRTKWSGTEYVCVGCFEALP
jgi:hypothetical protein